MVEINLHTIADLLNKEFPNYQAARAMMGGSIEIRALDIKSRQRSVPLAKIDYNNGKVIVKVVVENTDHLETLREMYNAMKDEIGSKGLEVDFIYNCKEVKKEEDKE